MPEVDIDINGIKKVLPHRYPFLLIDRVIFLEEQSKVIAIKNVSGNEEFFSGHFPGFPIMPGVLIIEAIAQAGAFGMLASAENQGKFALFAGIDNVRFRKPVFPGDQLRIEVEYMKSRGPIAKMKGVAMVNDQVVCESELMCSVVSKEQSKASLIDPTAIVHQSVKIGKGVRVGPFTTIGPEVSIGDNTVIESGVVIARWTTIGKDCRIMNGVTIATPPQDHKYKGERNEVVIGDRCIIREFATIHLPTGEGEKTSIGNDCMIMTNVHIPHNAKIGNNVVISSFAGLSGHAEIADNVIIGGLTGIHQHVRIGKMAMIGGQAKIVQDVPPFMLADGNPAQVRALNIIGLQRRGVSLESQVELKKAFKIIYKSNLNLTLALEELKKKCKPLGEIKELIAFLEQETDRGILKKSEQTDDLLFPEIPELGI